MTNLDEVAIAIGQLKAQHEESTRQRKALFEKLDVITNKQNELHGLHRELLIRYGELEREIREEIKPVTDDYKRIKNRGIGVIVAIGIVSGSVGVGVSKLLAKLAA